MSGAPGRGCAPMPAGGRHAAGTADSPGRNQMRPADQTVLLSFVQPIGKILREQSDLPIESAVKQTREARILTTLMLLVKQKSI